METQMPEISIVLPTYNGETYLKEALGSIRSQTFKNWELIVVDDCSTDSTPDIIQAAENKDNRICHIRNEQNKRLPASLNAGFKSAKGKFHTWTSDDNCFRPEALKKMRESLTEDPSVDFVYCDYTLIDELGKEGENVTVMPSTKLIERNYIGACFLYKSLIFEKLGGYAEDLIGAEDYDFWLRTSCSFKMEPLHENLYKYRIHQNSMTEQRASLNQKAKWTALLQALPYLTLSDTCEVGKAYARIAKYNYQQKDYKRLRKLIWKALIKAPFGSQSYLSRGMWIGLLLGWGIAEKLRS